VYFASGQLVYSPSDLITFMESEYASAMERLKLNDDEISELVDEADVVLSSLQAKGYAHEDAFTERLKTLGKDVLETKRATPEQTYAATIEAMKSGHEVITQGYLSLGQFGGFTDYLIKVPGSSNFGDYHYEVWDTKLSKSLKPYFAIQLCCYIEMLEVVQGVRPKEMVIVLGDETEARLTVENYFAYYKILKASFLKFHDKPIKEMPSPVLSKTHGRWSNLAARQLEEIDHLSQVAGIARSQIKSLENAGIATMTALAETSLDIIPNINRSVFERAKKQAALQIISRDKDRPEYSVIKYRGEEVRGLAALPPLSQQDVFFDIEGYPYIEGGLEYLWGNSYIDAAGKRQFKDFWAHDSLQEKQIFEEFIDWIYARWLKDPLMHVYHYANYEIAAIQRLMGRYGVCEEKVDNLLRNNVFVDLYNIVRHGLIIGEPRYSIKNVEHIYRGKRETIVASGAESIIVYENWRDNPDGDSWENSAILKSIRDYNIDDCDSTLELTHWLRDEQAKHNITYVQPEIEGEKEISEEVTEVTKFRDKLLGMADIEPDNIKAKILEVLAWSLEFHRRENKPTWWRLFDRMGWTEPEFYDDMECLAGLTRTASEPYLPTSRSRNYIYEYAYDTAQPFKGASKSFYVLGEEGLKLSCKDFDPERGLIAFSHKEPLPARMNILPDQYVRPDPIPSAIKSMAEEALDDKLAPSALIDFLSRSRPRIKNNPDGFIVSGKDDFLDDVIAAAVNLNDSYLCIQGPPGAGKTFTAKHIIGELLRRGKRVGISSNSHKAIINLMKGVAEYVEAEGIDAAIFKAGGDKHDPIFEHENVKFIQSVKKFIPQDSVCFGGTAWAFSNECVEDCFDYLFIDEAGQVSVANLIGMSRACRNIILMGDQMQLGQPIQGTHPGESGLSILDYLLEGQSTIAPEMGVFLPTTYRMHPDVCDVISRQVYDGKLSSNITTHKHVVEVKGRKEVRKKSIALSQSLKNF